MKQKAFVAAGALPMKIKSEFRVSNDTYIK